MWFTEARGSLEFSIAIDKVGLFDTNCRWEIPTDNAAHSDATTVAGEEFNFGFTRLGFRAGDDRIRDIISRAARHAVESVQQSLERG